MSRRLPNQPQPIGVPLLAAFKLEERPPFEPVDDRAARIDDARRLTALERLKDQGAQLAFLGRRHARPSRMSACFHQSLFASRNSSRVARLSRVPEVVQNQ